jgi:hypothetical protein
VPLLGADPERAVAVLEQVLDAVAPQRRHPLAVEHFEADAVEAHQPVEGGEPQEPVAGLQRLDDARHGQAVFHAEDLVDVTGSAGEGVEGAGQTGTGRHGEAHGEGR